ncbi:MAG: HD domain-containing protein [Erysipelotrichales bacterium]|nr:HD domain-containing protein [Erysipelotrichales bacterium]
MKIDNSLLIEGMVLSKNIILDENLNETLNCDTILTMADIVRIKDAGIKEVSVHVGDKYNTFGPYFDYLIKSILERNNIDEFKALAKIMCDILSKEELLQYDLSIYLSENYNHLVNSIEIATIVAKKYNDVTEKSKQVSLEKVILASLLQDSGRRAKDKKLLLSLRNSEPNIIGELFKTYSTLSEEIFTYYDSKYHPVYSYLICKNYNLDDDICKAILFHHEKETGEYSLLNSPLSDIEESEFVIIARILKLADLYDIIVRNNVENNKNLPFVGIGKQIDKMVASGFVNARLTNILKTVIPIYQVGTKVLLTDGTKGVIESNDPNDYNNPEVVDLNGKPIDLEKENIAIIRHLED